MGLDPVIEDIPIKTGSNKEKIISFYESILNKIIQQKVYPSAVKPNFAFYAQYGIEGIEALLSVIELYKSQDIPVILDAKRGDIAKTALAYAKECFGFYKADAVTLAPYMGYDSIAPFIDN
jgi:orotidine-5'-phosphate decarboxylase